VKFSPWNYPVHEIVRKFDAKAFAVERVMADFCGLETGLFAGRFSAKVRRRWFVFLRMDMRCLLMGSLFLLCAGDR